MGVAVGVAVGASVSSGLTQLPGVELAVSNWCCVKPVAQVQRSILSQSPPLAQLGEHEGLAGQPASMTSLAEEPILMEVPPLTLRPASLRG